MRARTSISLLSCLLLAASCGGGGGGGGGNFAPSPIKVSLEPAFAALSFSAPLAMVQAPVADSPWYVAERGGTVRVFADDDAVTEDAIFINLTARVDSSCGECGLLGIAFDPGFEANGYVYLSYTRGPGAQTPAASLTSYLSRFTSPDGGLTLDPASEVVVLTLLQPFTNHNGGHLVFGPDGYLYAGFGDGGSGNDPLNRAQNTSNLFGTIIRIDVSSLPYAIPTGQAGNVFAGNPHCTAGSGDFDCPEIYAWGLRNPWRFTFDRVNGDLWIGDVGQSSWEEIDLISSADPEGNTKNFGWPIREGAHCNKPPDGCPTVGLTDPVTEYGRDVGRSVTGGFVYRGTAIARLAGSYVFGDFISGRLLALAPGATVPDTLLDTSLNIASFAEGADGELYVVNFGGTLHRLRPGT